MWLYILTFILCICLAKILPRLKKYRDICHCLSHFPLPLDNHWFFGISHKATDAEMYMQALEKTVDKIQPKAIAVWLTWLFPGLAVVHPETCKAVLKASHISAPKGPDYQFFVPWLGESLLISGGKKWERQRRLLTPAFHFDVLKPYVTVYGKVAEVLIKRIKALTVDGQSIDIPPLISHATLDSVLRCAFSYEDESIQSMNKRENKFFENISKVKAIIIRRYMNPLLHNDFIYGLTKDYREMKRYCLYLHEFSMNLIKQRRQSITDDPAQLNKRHLDFLDILLTARDENDAGLSDLEIRAEVDTFVFAGHDTTTSAIMWALYAFAKYPEMQETAREEINDILSNRRYLSHDDLTNLQFTTRFIKESMRMFTPVPSIARRLAEPLTIDGVTVPAGTFIDVNQHCLHHNPAVWKNHNKFDPDRFLSENFAEMDPFTFLPFSAGQRNCIGQNFAMNELKVMISQVIRRFQITLDESKPAVPYRDAVTLAKSGIHIFFKEIGGKLGHE